MKNLSNNSSSKMKEEMQYPEEINKMKAQITEIKEVMMKNVDKVLDRGENMEILVDKRVDLRAVAEGYRTEGDELRRKMWLQHTKIKLIVLGIIIALILIVVLSICGGFNCGK